MNFIKKNWPWLSLIAVGFFIYAFNLHNGLFWDDDDWIINNQFVHSFSWDNIKFWFTHNTLAGVGLKSNYYRPFLFFTFAINYVISGIKPLSYHLLSNLIHIANSILIFSIFYLVFRKKLVAFITALIFLIHPLQTEAVTYIAGRGDPLYVFFMLLALWLFVKAEHFARKRKLLYGILSAGSLILALLSREVAIIYPLLLIAFYIAFLSKEKFWRSLKIGIIKSFPYLGVAVVYGILRLTVLNFLNTLNFYAVHNIYADHLYVRLFTFLKVLLAYFKLLIVPVGLHMEQGMNPQLSFWNWPVWAAFLGLVALIIWLLILYKRERRSMTNADSQISNFRIWFFGASWFFIGLAPVSGIVPINAILYEHWLYLPMLGFFVIAVYYFVDLLDHLKQTRKPLFVICILLFGAYISFYAVQSVKRNILWGKPIEFYIDILKYEPDSVRINNNLGNLYFNNGDKEKAQNFYQKAVDSEDIFPQPHYNLGSILQSKGDTYGAIQEYEKAIELDPNFYYPYLNLVAIYARQGELEKASQYVTKLDELRPNDPRILYNAALIYSAQGNFSLALRKAQQGVAYAGSDAEVRQALEELIIKLTK